MSCFVMQGNEKQQNIIRKFKRGETEAKDVDKATKLRADRAKGPQSRAAAHATKVSFKCLLCESDFYNRAVHARDRTVNHRCTAREGAKATDKVDDAATVKIIANPLRLKANTRLA